MSFLPTALRLPRYWRVRRADGSRTAAIVRLLGLDKFASKEAATLPVGTRRLVEVARALAADAQVILFDEVASGLDEDELEHLVTVIGAIRDAGVTVVLVEHNFDLVLRLADIIYVLAQGRLIAAGSPAEIRGNTEVERVYLGSAPDATTHATFETLATLAAQPARSAPEPDPDAQVGD
jgi:branched-chain amino acid transport system permease protein